MKSLSNYPLIFTIGLSITFILGFSVKAQITQQGQDIDGEASFDYSGSSVSINAIGDLIAIGAPTNDGNGSYSGHVRVYEWSGSSWIQRGQDIDGENSGDQCGHSVSMNAAGNLVAIGAIHNDANGNSSGQVRVYEWNGIIWTQKGQDIDGEATYDQSGFSVSMNNSGNILAIGANGNNSDKGHVRVYSWIANSWVQLGQDIDGEAFYDFFGNSVSMNAAGNSLAIGGYNNDGNGNNAGHVRVFTWNGSSWLQQGQDIDGEAVGDLSGWTVSMNGGGNIVAIGANGNDGNGSYSGHVRIYEWNNNSWVQMGQDIDGESVGDEFGYSVSLNNIGNRIAVGARLNNGSGVSSGHARIYAWDGFSWTQQGQDINGENGGDRFGSSISMNSNGDLFVIGGPLNDGNGSSAGHVRIYYDPNAIVNVGFEVSEDIVCLNDTIYFMDTSITNATAWQWDFGDGQSSTVANPYHVYAQEGNYDVTLIISDSAGALDSATYDNYVHVIGLNSVIASSQDSVCLTGGSVHLDVSALTTNNIPYQLSWNTGDTSTQITNLIQGDYNYTLNTYQCVIQDTLTIGIGPNSAINLQIYSDNVSCFGFDGSAGIGLINGQVSGVEENFDTGNFSLTSWNNTLSSIPWFISNTSHSNPYSMESGNISNGGNSSVELDILLNDSASVNFMKSVSSENNYDFLRFYIDGALMGSWSGNVSWSQSTYDIGSGYHVFKWAYTKDGSLSSGLDAAWVDDIIISGNGLSGFTYQWNDPLQQTTPSISGLNAGVYLVTVTDSLGCSGLDSAIVEPFTAINVLVNTQDITCEGLTDGTATAVVTGGDTPYTYQFSGGISSDSVTTSLSTGAYYVNITDHDNCTAMGNFYIYDASVPTISLTGVDPSCASGNDGTISSIITNGNAPFTYLWNDTLQQTTPTATNLTNGTYTLTISDSLNCSYDTSVTISNEFIVDVMEYPPSCYGFSNGSAALYVSNGNTPTYSWNTGATSDSIYGLADGYYLFTISDGVLCDYSDTAFIEEPDSLILTAQITNVSCNSNNGSIQVNTNSNNQSSNVLKMENNGNKYLTNYDEYISVIYPDKISFDIMSPNVSSSSNNFHSSFLVEDGSSDLVWFAMSTDVNTSLPIMGPMGMAGGSSTVVSSYYNYNVYPFYYTPGNWYHVEFRNISFSANSYDYYVNNQLVAANIPFRQSPINIDRIGISHYTTDSVTSYFDNIDFSANGNSLWNEDYENGLSSAYNSSYFTNTIVNVNVLNYGSAANYTWSNGDNTYSINNLAPGSYTVNVSTSANCTETATYQIVDLGSPIISFNTNNTSCLGSSDGNATIQVSGGVAPYNYSYNQGYTLENTIIAEGVESGMGNFYSFGTQPFTITNIYTHSGDSAYYNAYGNYNDNYLICDSVFDFTNMSNGSFDFWHIAKTRGSDDYCFIEFSTNNGSSWFKIPSTNYNGSASTYTGSYPYFDEYSYTIWGSSSSPNNNWWIEESFDLSFLSGNSSVMFRFHLNSDNLYTKFGWLIDDISIKANDANDSLIVNLSNGVFSISVTDQNGCVVLDSTNIGANPYNMNLALTSTNTSCPGANNGSLQVNVTGGVSPYNYYYYQDMSSIGNDTLLDVNAENGNGNFLSSGSNYFYASSLFSQSGNFSFFNNYNNYDFNYFTYNTDIDLSNASSASLNFWQIAKTEGGYDFCYVEYSDNGGNTWQPIPTNYYNGNANNYSGTSPSFDEDSYTVWGTTNTTPSNSWWKEENFDLSFLAGESDLRIRFRLTSNNTSYRYGWLLDDILLTVNDNQGPIAYDLTSGMVYVQVVDSVGCGTMDSTSIGANPYNMNTTLTSSDVSCSGATNGSVQVNVNGGALPYSFQYYQDTLSNNVIIEDGAEVGVSNFISSGSVYFYSYSTFSHTGNWCYFNNYNNYDNNYFTYNTDIDLTYANNASLNFWQIAKTEGGYDFCYVEYSDNGGNTWQTIPTNYYNGNSSNYSGTSPSFDEDSYTDWGTTNTTPSNSWWKEENFDLSFLAGESDVRIRFRLTSNNTFSRYGWLLDDIVLTINDINANGSMAYNLSSGMVYVQVTDSVGCSLIDSTNIGTDTIFNVIMQPNDVNCFGDQDGSINISVSGGTYPYTYTWTSNSGANYTEGFESPINSIYWNSFSGSIGSTCGVNSGANALVFDHSGLRSLESTAQSAGPNSSISFYLLYGASSNSCETVDAGEEVSLEFSFNGSVWNNINTYNLLSYQSGVYEYIAEPIPVSAYGPNVYFRIVQYSNSGAGYDEWSIDDVTLNLASAGISTSNPITNLGPGFYNVNVTDSAGCTHNQNVTIQQPPALNNSLSSTNANCPTGNTGSLSATATGGVPPYSYLWSSGQTTSQVNNVVMGTYQCTITDQNNCATSGVVTVGSTSNLVANLSANNITCFGLQNGFANISATGGFPPYSYLWSNGQTTNQISNLGPGTYSVTVTDNLNCNSQLSTTINEPTDISINLQSANTSQGLNNGSASASVSGGTPPYSLIWNSGQVSYNIYNLAPGFYILTVTDFNNCQKSDTVLIQQGSVDIQENESSLAISITPNPFINEAYIAIDGYRGMYDLKVLNIQGKEVERHEKMQGGFVLNKGDKAPGMYFLVLILERNKLKELIIIE